VPGSYHKNRNRDLMVIRVALEVHTHSSRNMKDLGFWDRNTILEFFENKKSPPIEPAVPS